MADSACYIELASNNGDFFTNSTTDDIMIRPQYATQDILIGTSNGVSTLTITSNSVGIGTSTPAYTLDVAGIINATNYTGTTITSLSNLGMFSSNTSVSASNTTISLSNYVYGTTTTNITNAQTTASWSSNNLLNKAGDTMTGVLSLSSNTTLNSNSYAGRYSLNITSTSGLTPNLGSGISFFQSVSSPNSATPGASIIFERTTGGSAGNLHFGTKGTTGASDPCHIRMTINSNGFVGISNQQPAYALDVSGDINFTGAFRQNGVPYVGSQWSNNNANVFLLGSNVGIGTSSPNYQLDVNGVINIKTGGLRMVEADNTYIGVNAVGFAPSLGIVKKVGYSPYFAFTSNSGGVNTANSMNFGMLAGSNLAAVGDCNLTTMMTIANTGDVGIGTTSPSYKLDVNGTMKATRAEVIGDTDETYLWVRTNVNNKIAGIRLHEAGDVYGGGIFYDGADDKLHIGQYINSVSMSKYMTIDYTGNIGVGTTSPSYKLDVNGTARINNTTAIYGGNGVGGGAILSLRNTATANEPRWIFRGPDWGNNAGLFIGYNECNDTSFNAGVNGGNPAMNIRAVGSYYTVGIGTSGNSSFGLQVNGTYCPYGQIASFVYSNVTTLIGTGDVATRYNGLVKQGDSLIVGYSNAINTGGLVLGTWSAGMSGIRVDGPTGYVGVGSSNPAYKLDVVGDVIASWIRTRNNTGWYNETYGGGFYMTDTTWVRTYGTKNFFHDGSIMRTDGQLHVGNGGSTFLCSNGGDFAYRTNVLVANTAGNVGIGTASPAYKLDVAGTINATSYSNVSYFYLKDQPSQIWRSDLLGTSVNSAGYFKVATLQDINSGANGTGVNIRGWAGPFGTKMKFECIVSTRGGVNMKAYTSGPIYDSATDIMIYQESDNTFSVYFWNNSYYATWWFEVSANTSYGATLLTPSATRTTPTGTLSTAMSSNLVTVATGTNFGIGTSNPAYKLDVSGNMKALSSSTITGVIVGTSDVATIIGNTAGAANYGSIQVRAGGSSSSVGSSTYKLYLQPDGGDILIGSGNLGIGTETPLSKLDVNGDTVIRGRTIVGNSNYTLNTQGTFNVYNPGSLDTGGARVWITASNQTHMTIGKHASVANGDGYIWLPGAHGFAIGTNNTERLKIDSSGNVGIGITSPTSKLHVGGLISIQQNGETRYHLYNNGGAAEWKFGQKSQSSHNFILSKVISGTDSDYFAVDTSGNVGIGTVTPSQKLHVVGNSILNGGNQIVVQNSQDGGTGRGIYMWALADTNWGIYMGTAGATKSLSGGTAVAGNGFVGHSVRFRVANSTVEGFIFENSAEALLMSIRGDGLTYIAGNTTLYNTSIGNVGHGGAYAAFCHSNQFNTSAYALLHQDNGTTYLNCASGTSIRFRENNGDIAILTGYKMGILTTSPSYQLHVVGTIYATGDIIGFSDIRLKSNITIIDSALSKIHKLNGYTFNIQDDEKAHTGLIAQEVLEVLPEAVHQEKKADGTDGYYSLAYGNMAGLFVEAIKEIDNKYKAQITELTETISILKQEIDLLKNKK